MNSIYSDLASIYHELFPENQQLISYLKRILQAESAILDIGCGNGQTSGSLQNSGFKVLGTDIDESMIAHARTFWPRATFQQLDMRSIDKLKKTFDCIYCIGNVISYLSNNEKQIFINKIYSLLNPEGFWISQFVNWDAVVAIDHYRFPVRRLDTHAAEFYREYTDVRPESVSFNTRLEWKDKTITNKTIMYPVMVEQYFQFNEEAGFSFSGHYRDFGKTSYDPEPMTGNVFIYRKIASIN